MSEPVLLTFDGPVARLTLNRPNEGNAIDVELARALRDAVLTCRTDPKVRCLVLTGNGRLFCAGGDVAKLNAAGKARPGLLKEILSYLHPAIAMLMRMDKPIVTAIHGPAAGAGLSLAIAGDVALATPRASFTPAYAAIGLSPDAGATWLVPRLVGLRRAQEIFLTNRRISAEEAAAIGLVTRIVPEAQLPEETDRVVGSLVDLPTAALGTTRQLLMRSSIVDLEAQLEAELKAIVAHGAGPENEEGLAAFADKRPPDFRSVIR